MTKEKIPCRGMIWNEITGRDEFTSPAVSCARECGKCGWNPAEHKRRLKTGHFVQNAHGGRTLVFRHG